MPELKLTFQKPISDKVIPILQKLFPEITKEKQFMISVLDKEPNIVTIVSPNRDALIAFGEYLFKHINYINSLN